MSVNRMFLFTAIASAMAVLFSLVYRSIYTLAFLVDFSDFPSAVSIFAATVFGTTLLFAAHFFSTGRYGRKAERWLNPLMFVLSFVSMFGSFAVTLPPEIESPELFPGLVVPMHFFPLLSFWCLLPFYGDPQK